MNKAIENLKLKEPKKINSSLMRLMSIFRGIILFYKFERSRSKIKLSATTQRFGTLSFI